jgi:hypothetical protein
MEITTASLERALEVLGQLLHDRGSHYEVVAIGGGSLLLLGQITRPTKDLDIVALVDDKEFISAKPLPLRLIQAAEEVGIALQLDKQWLNPGPTSLLELGLPFAFKARMHTRHYKGLTVHLAGRFDQICFKLYAAVDQGPYSKHFADLKSLLPTNEELLSARQWCTTHDVSEAFAQELDATIFALMKVDEKS